MPAFVIQFLVPLMTQSEPSWIAVVRIAAGVGAGVGLRQAERRRLLAGRAIGQEPLLQLVRAEQLDRQRAELLDHQDQGDGRRRLRELLDRDLQHQRAGPGAAVLLGERQAEDVLLGQQLADVPRVLVGPVDLGGARRDPLGRDLAHEVAEVLCSCGIE